MKEQILKGLEAIEHHLDVRVLLAVESGSRAWGFASDDSDYDVRFIFMRPAVDHMRLTKVPDVIDKNYTFTLEEEAIRQAYPNSEFPKVYAGWEDPLDFSGWDIRKFLNAARDCNSSAYEWVHSPAVYLEREQFKGIKGLMKAHFRPIKSFHHYLNMGLTTLQEAHNLGTVKNALYALRCLLAAHYVARYLEAPPVPLDDLVDAFCIRSETEYRFVPRLHATLVEQKTSEDKRVHLDSKQWAILDALYQTAKRFEKQAWPQLPSPDLALSNSTLMAYSTFLQGQYACAP